MKRVSRPARASSNTKRRNTTHKAGKSGHIRIIGGQWRGRKLPVIDAEGLRPTTDRNKETLFNWLMQYTQNARCLDVFAGAGSLGLEALSRYATSCDFIELDKQAREQLVNNLRTLAVPKESSTTVHAGDALAVLPQLNKLPYDIVFVDPPFNKGLVEPTLNALDALALVQQGSRIYVEHEAALPPLSLPDHWQVTKEKHTSALRYFLIEVS